MNYRKFGREEIEISEIGLGCWQIGGNWGEVDNSTARDIIKTTLDSGVNFLDTADVYGDGRSESIIGDYLNGKTEGLFIATKVGRTGNLYPDKYTPENITECIEASLKRLRVDCLDLVQTHCIPEDVMKSGEIFDVLRDLKSQGKIHRFGSSIESMEEANWSIDNIDDLYSLQIIFNIFRQKPITTLFDKALETKTGILARVPLASGLLTGKLTQDTEFRDEDHRNFNKDGEAFNVGETFAGLPYEKGLELSSKLKAFKQSEGTMAQWALRWIIDHPAVSVVIPGASKVEQAAANAAVSDQESLSKEAHKTLNNFYESEIKDYIRGPY